MLGYAARFGAPHRHPSAAKQADAERMPRVQSQSDDTVFLDHGAIEALLTTTKTPAPAHVREVLAKAGKMKGLDPNDVAVLSAVRDPELTQELFDVAGRVKTAIYGRRMVLFAPLYISNLCANECVYCAFRARNKDVVRRALTQDEIAQESRALEDQGHKRVLLVAGESYPQEGLDYVLKSIRTVYATKSGDRGEIRRVNVNIAPLTLEEFKRLHAENIGTYQLFQETYHLPTYKKVHLAGRKADYAWRLTAFDRAMKAGFGDVGVGVLFGLHDWRFEILALMRHIRHLEEHFGVGPHTISVPRLEPAAGSDVASHPPHAVDDDDFRRIVSILRLAVPYTGVIMSTRETARMRRETFALGVSQISAGSRTNPGGYSLDEEGTGTEDAAQFSLGDHRDLDEVVADLAAMGYIPSFCTGCYRMGRVGKDFMDLARPGEIKKHCDPNGLSTFLEYLLDYASPSTRATGEALISRTVAEMSGTPRARAEELLARIRAGERDAYF